jgi:hypothetical protein
MRCSDLARHATDYSEGALLPLARWRARRHLRGCDPCRAYVTQLQLTARALPRLAVAPTTSAQEAAALALFRQWRAEGAPAAVAVVEEARAAPRFAAIVIATGLASALGLAFARQLAPIGSAWLQGAFLEAAACGLMLLALRRGVVAALLATLLAAVPVLALSHGSLAFATGMKCVIHELVTAAVPLVALVLLRRTTGISRAGIAGIAASGALAGDAALHVSCPAASSAVHLLVFHVGGVALAAALVGIFAGRMLRLGTATA